MSTRKTTVFYALLIAVASLAVGMVLASRLGLAPDSSAQTTIAVPPMNSAPVTGAIDAQTFRNIAKAAKPMVVNIQTQVKTQGRDLTDFFGGGSPDDLFNRFFGTPGQPEDRGPGQGQGAPNGRQRRPREQTTRAAGTGFIISKDGFILTNNHVVDEAVKIEVGLFGDDSDVTYEAKVIGKDPLTDSALIQMLEHPKEPLTEAKFGDSSQMAAGDWVMAIGNPFNYAHTVTIGVISAEKRPFPVTDGRNNEVMQTDAAINPGNSGGPLLNVRGEVIGMNTAIVTNARSEGNIGIGFAVPINTVRDLLPQLRNGKVIRGRIGVTVIPVPREDYQEFGLKTRSGAIVASIASGGAAAKGGVEPGDVIVQFNGRPVSNSDELVKMVVGTKPGTNVPVKVMRNKQERTLNLTVDELDLEAEQQSRGRRSPGQDPQQDDSQGAGGFGLTLDNVTPQMARRLGLPSGQTGAVITDVEPDGPSAGRLQPGDVILSVNRRPVSNASEAARALQQIQSGKIAQILAWRLAGEVFVTVKKD